MNAQVHPSRHRITVEEYGQMGAAGIFGDNARIELIKGEIFDRAPIGNRHATAVRRLIHLISTLIGKDAILDVQNPIRLAADSQPEPDLVLLRPRPDFYAATTPTGADVLLLIEVADTSLDYDRDTKLPLYARHGISEVWLVDLNAEQVEVHSTPSESGYARVQTLAAGTSITPSLLPEIELAVADILPGH